MGLKIKDVMRENLHKEYNWVYLTVDLLTNRSTVRTVEGIYSLANHRNPSIGVQPFDTHTIVSTRYRKRCCASSLDSPAVLVL